MVINQHFKTKVWQTERRYQIILPKEYHESTMRYPVLYLLHGANQNYQSWTKYTFLEVLAEQYPLIMASPDGGDNWYRNNDEGILNHREYILEFISFIDKNFRTKTQRQYRGVSGISMGGYASFFVGITNPNLFGSVSALSGVMDITKYLTADPTIRGGMDRNAKTMANLHLFDLVKQLNGFTLKLLFDSGTEDEISYEASCNFDRLLRELRIPHSFNKYGGAHDWYYWDLHLQEHLDFHWACFKQ